MEPVRSRLGFETQSAEIGRYVFIGIGDAELLRLHFRVAGHHVGQNVTGRHRLDDDTRSSQLVLQIVGETGDEGLCGAVRSGEGQFSLNLMINSYSIILWWHRTVLPSVWQ